MINLKNLIFYIDIFDRPIVSWEEPVKYCYWSSSIKNSNKIILSYLIIFLTPMMFLGLTMYIYSNLSSVTIQKYLLTMYAFIAILLVGLSISLGLHNSKTTPKPRRVFITKKAIQINSTQVIPYKDILEYNIINVLHNQDRLSVLLILIKNKRIGFTIGIPLNIQTDDIHKVLSLNIRHNDKLSLSKS